MDLHALLRLMHITSFAAWFRTVLASLFLLKTLEPELTDNASDAPKYAAILKQFNKRETKVADVAFIGVILSETLLAWLYHGWCEWVFVKTALLVVQAAVAMGYIIRFTGLSTISAKPLNSATGTGSSPFRFRCLPYSFC